MRVRLLSDWISTSFGMAGLLWILYLYSGAAVGADIRVYKSPTAGGIDIIQYSGDVEQGDYETFVGLLEPNQKALLVLSSNGGSLRDGLQIGIEVRLRGISTSVMADKECYSACALIWLAGRNRLMAATSDPPPLKWSDLKYVFRHQGGLDHAKEEAHTGGDHREAATG